MKVVGIAHKVEKGKPMVELLEAEVRCATGVADDLSGGPGKRQVTLLSGDVWHEVCAELKQELPWTVRRANILLEGVAFSPDDVGRILAIGDLHLEITKETVPCKFMDDQVPGLREMLGSDWRGGVCCRVVQDGDIALVTLLLGARTDDVACAGAWPVRNCIAVPHKLFVLFCK